MPQAVELLGVLGRAGQKPAVLALALGEELLEPLAEAGEARLEEAEELDAQAGVPGGLPGAGVVPRHVGARGRREQLALLVARARHERADVGAGEGERQQVHAGQGGVAAADVGREGEELVALLAAQVLERRAGRAAADDAPRGLALAVPGDEALAQEPERRARLEGLEVLGHAVDGHLVALEVLEDAVELERRERVARPQTTRGAPRRRASRRGPPGRPGRRVRRCWSLPRR